MQSTVAVNLGVLTQRSLSKFCCLVWRIIFVDSHSQIIYYFREIFKSDDSLRYYVLRAYW